MSKSDIILDSKYKITSLLGKGHTSSVFLAEDIETHDKVAVKIYKYELEEYYNLESAILDKLLNSSCPFLMRMVGYNEDAILIDEKGKKKFSKYLALELAERGELFYYIKFGGDWEEKYSRYLLKCLATAISEMHSQDIVHRDIKLDNIILNRDYVVKLSDFGFAEFNENSKNGIFKSEFIGTHGYAAPQVYSKLYNGKAADIFSLGVVFFMIATKRKPFRKYPDKSESIVGYLKSKNFENYCDYLSNKIGITLSKSLNWLIFNMLAYEEKDRFTIAEVMESEWMKEGDIATQNEFAELLECSRKSVEKQQNLSEVEYSKIKEKSQGDYRGEIVDELADIQPLIASLEKQDKDKITLNSDKHILETYKINIDSSDIVSTFKCVFVYFKRLGFLIKQVQDPLTLIFSTFISEENDLNNQESASKINEGNSFTIGFYENSDNSNIVLEMVPEDIDRGEFFEEREEFIKYFKAFSESKFQEEKIV